MYIIFLHNMIICAFLSTLCSRILNIVSLLCIDIFYFLCYNALRQGWKIPTKRQTTIHGGHSMKLGIWIATAAGIAAATAVIGLCGCLASAEGRTIWAICALVMVAKVATTCWLFRRARL